MMVDAIREKLYILCLINKAEKQINIAPVKFSGVESYITIIPIMNRDILKLYLHPFIIVIIAIIKYGAV